MGSFYYYGVSNDFALYNNNWFNDDVMFIYDTFLWICRGGIHSLGKQVGQTAFSWSYRNPNIILGFRITLSN